MMKNQKKKRFIFTKLLLSLAVALPVVLGSGNITAKAATQKPMPGYTLFAEYVKDKVFTVYVNEEINIFDMLKKDPQLIHLGGTTPATGSECFLDVAIDYPEGNMADPEGKYAISASDPDKHKIEGLTEGASKIRIKGKACCGQTSIGIGYANGAKVYEDVDTLLTVNVIKNPATIVNNKVSFIIPEIVKGTSIVSGTVFIGSQENKHDGIQTIDLTNWANTADRAYTVDLNQAGTYHLTIVAKDNAGYSYKYEYLANPSQWDVENDRWNYIEGGVQQSVELVAIPSSDFINNAQWITGNVVDRLGNPVEGANISYRGINLTTGADGKLHFVAGVLDNTASDFTVSKTGYDVNTINNLSATISKDLGNIILNSPLVTVDYTGFEGNGTFAINGTATTNVAPSVAVLKDQDAEVKIIPETGYYVASYTINGVTTKLNPQNGDQVVTITQEFTADATISAIFAKLDTAPVLDPDDRIEGEPLNWTASTGKGISYAAAKDFDFSAYVDKHILDDRFGTSWVQGASSLADPVMYMNLQVRTDDDAYGTIIKQIGSANKFYALGNVSAEGVTPPNTYKLDIDKANYKINDNVVPGHYVQKVDADFYTADTVCANHWYHVGGIKFHKNVITRTFNVYKDTMAARMDEPKYEYGKTIYAPTVATTDDSNFKDATIKYYKVDAAGNVLKDLGTDINDVKDVGSYKAVITYAGDAIVAKYAEGLTADVENGEYPAIEISFEIVPAKLANGTDGSVPGLGQFTVSAVNDKDYTGSEITQEVIVQVNVNTPLTLKSDDYKVEYAKNVNTGTATRTITITNPSYVDVNGDPIVYTQSFGINPIDLTYVPSKTVPTADGELTLNTIPGHAYTGKAITPATVVTAMINGKVITLTPDVDYTVLFDENIAVGNANRTIKLINDNYSAFAGIADTFEITKLPLKVVTGTPSKDGELAITGLQDYVYDGTSKVQDKLTLTAMVGGELKVLKSGTDYTVAYKKNVNAGTAELSISMNSPYAYGLNETINKTFTINPLDITVTDKAADDLTVDGEMSISGFGEYIYDGHAYEPEAIIHVLVNGKVVQLIKGIDFEATYDNNVNAGTATRTIKMLNPNYAMADIVEEFTISPIKLAFVEGKEPTKNGEMTISPIVDMDYTGQALTQNAIVKVMVDGKVVTLDADEFEVTYKNNIAAGVAERIIKVTNPNYALGTDGTYVQKFTIRSVKAEQTEDPKLEGEFTVSATKDVIFNGTPITQITEMRMMLGGRLTTLREGIDFEVTYKENVKAGIATRTIHFINPSLIGKDIVDTFKIASKPITENNGKPGSDIVIEGFKDDVTFNGSAITQNPKFYVNGKLLIEGVDYDVVYSENNKIGKATVTYTFKGDYTGIITKTFNIKDPNANAGNGNGSNTGTGNGTGTGAGTGSNTNTGTTTGSSTGDATNAASLMFMMTAAGACALTMLKKRNKNSK